METSREQGVPKTGWAFFDAALRRTWGLRVIIWWLAASLTTVIAVGFFIYLLFWQKMYEPAAQMAIALAVLFYTGNPAVQRLIGGNPSGDSR